MLTGNEKDKEVVINAGRSIKNMLRDLMQTSEVDAESPVWITGDLTLRIEGRHTYTIKLFHNDGEDPDDLKVRIERQNFDRKKADEQAASEKDTSRKRAHDDVDEPVSIAKRARAELLASEPGPTADAPVAPDTNGTSTAPVAWPSDDAMLAELQTLSSQIRWVEECRRVADELHDQREETWRATSALFHDDRRKDRERHEQWLQSEVSWQRNLLIQLSNDIKGIYPLVHSLKWGPSASLLPPQPPPQPQQTPHKR
ncbi:hypothetical protein EJ06DRAFT_522175 [Trichodelitschia bisporula]|uniref:Uncharacterized protein n=1 Tax=Trichodelitschia bisporula TaxID=703511 RepID=A0A6G1HV87_9PEZI|nr:hypothetical protein EJ06DRAFT_522175 [Trichodelitschia bisporula]